MFDLDNILHFAELNIQTIGIFIAIIGGLLVTKLLNLKIEKSELSDKLNILNKEIEFNSGRIKMRKDKIIKNNREAFINDIYLQILEDDFNIEEYEPYDLSLEERKKVCEEVVETYKKAGNVFKGKEYYHDDIDKILSDNKIYTDNEMYWVYYEVGSRFAKVKNNPYGLNIPDLSTISISNKFATLQENLEERDLSNEYNKLVDINEWKNIERKEIELKIKAIDDNLKVDLITFIMITVFGIVVPQVIISIYPLFTNYKFLKYCFAIYSIFTFIISMIVMMAYIYKMYKSLKK